MTKLKLLTDRFIIPEDKNHFGIQGGKVDVSESERKGVGLSQQVM
jgi:hypothetical protein